MISPGINIQVCHHPDSTHPVAQGRQRRWMSFGNTTHLTAAKMFVATISYELIKHTSVRVLVRNEYLPQTEHDITVDTTIFYDARPTFPERSAIDYKIPAGESG